MRRLTPVVGPAVLFAVLGLFDLSIGPDPPAVRRSGRLTPTLGTRPWTAHSEVYEPGYSGTLVSDDYRVAFRTNALGFRERELDFDALAAQRPILFVGDSLLTGWGVEEGQRLAASLERQLGGQGVAPPAVTLAIPGWGTHEYADALVRLGPRLRPRRVVVLFTVGSDFVDDRRSRRLRAAVPSPVPPAWAAARAFLRRSPAANYFRRTLWPHASFRRAFHRAELHNHRLALYLSEPTDAQAALYEATAEALARLEAAAGHLGAPLTVVVVPDHLQVHAPELLVEHAARRPQQRLAGRLAELGIDRVDLLQPILSHPDPTSLYFPTDKHWSPAGHALAAEVLVRHLGVSRAARP